MRALDRHPHTWLVLALTASLALSGCGKSPTKPTYQRQLTLFGYLYVGEPINAANAFRLGQTLPADAYFDTSRAAVTGALVLLRAEGAPLPDTLHEIAPGRYANPAITVAAHTTYHLDVVSGSDVLSGTTSTPGPLALLAEPAALPDSMRWDEIAFRHPIVVDGPDPEQLMLLDVYCLEPWQTAEYVNPFATEDHPQDYKEYGGDNGEPRHVWAYFRLGDLGPRTTGYRMNFYGDMMVFFGRYTVGVFAIDQNYYEYLYRDHPERHGGVRGGIGVFASAWRRQYQVGVTR